MSQISIWEVQIHILKLQHLKATTPPLNRKAHTLKWKLSNREENYNPQTEIIRSRLPGSQPEIGFAEVMDIYGCHWNQWEFSFLFHWKKNCCDRKSWWHILTPWKSFQEKGQVQRYMICNKQLSFIIYERLTQKGKILVGLMKTLSVPVNTACLKSLQSKYCYI